MKSIETGPTFLHDIHNELDAIKALPINLLDTRQERLVNLLVNIVHDMTEAGTLTKPDWGVLRQEYWKPLESHALDVGFKFLGAGHFSAAFSHEMLPDRVIKIGFKKEDSGAAYTAWCRANQHLAGVPVIHAVSREESCYTVVLDRLQDLTEARSVDAETRDQLDDEYYAVRDSIHGGDVSYSTVYAGELAETGKAIHKFFNGIASFDMHSENAMVNPKTGHLVITDPVSFSQDKVTECSSFDFEVLLAEIEELNKARLIDKWKRRNEMNRGLRCLGRKEARRAKKALARKMKEAENKRINGNKFIEICKALNPTALAYMQDDKLFLSEIWEEAAVMANKELAKRLLDVAAPANRVHAVDARMNEKFLMDHKGTPKAPHWAKVFQDMEERAIRHAIVGSCRAPLFGDMWDQLRIDEQLRMMARRKNNPQGVWMHAE